MVIDEIVLTCGTNNVGGVKNVYINNFISNHKDWVTVGGTLFPSGSLLSLGFERYETMPETSSYNTTSTKGVNGLFYFDTNITLTFPSMRREVYDKLLKVVDGRFSIIVEMNNGLKYYMGYTHPVVVNNMNANGGTSLEDGNSMSVSFKVSEKYAPIRCEIR